MNAFQEDVWCQSILLLWSLASLNIINVEQILTVYSKFNSQSTKWYNKNEIVMRIDRFVFFLVLYSLDSERNKWKKQIIRIEAKRYQQAKSEIEKEWFFLHRFRRINKIYIEFFQNVVGIELNDILFFFFYFCCEIDCWTLIQQMLCMKLLNEDRIHVECRFWME